MAMTRGVRTRSALVTAICTALMALPLPTASAVPPPSAAPSGLAAAASPGPVLPSEGGALDDPLLPTSTPTPGPAGSPEPLVVTPTVVAETTAPTPERQDNAASSPTAAASTSLVGWVGILLLLLVGALVAGVAFTTPALLHRSRASWAPQRGGFRPGTAAGARPARGVREAWRGLTGHGADLRVLLPLLVVTALALKLGLQDAPQRTAAEGSFVARAWDVLHPGQLTPSTTWLEHPPAGWLQVAAWGGGTGAFDRAPTSVGAGRELALVLTLVAAVLLWALARRLAMPRWAAGVAVAVFALSPLAIEVHRTADPTTIATPWLLGALLLVLGPGRSRTHAVAAAACFVVAVLSSAPVLLLLPLPVYLWWRRDRTQGRRGAVALMALGLLVAAAFALPGVLGGFDAPGSTGLTGPAAWVRADPVLTLAVAVAAVAGLALRSMRAVAVAVLALGVFVALVPGAVPQAVVIALLPLGALLVGGVAGGVWRYRPTRLVGRDVGRAGGIAAVALAAMLVVTAGAVWSPRLERLATAPLDRPLTEATAWLEQNVPPDQRILTDDALWVDLVRQGRSAGAVVPFSAVDAGSGEGSAPPQWVVTSESVRRDPEASARAERLREGATTAAGFGAGATLVEVLRVTPAGSDPAADSGDPAPAPDEPADPPSQDPGLAALSAGQQLLTNPAITTSDDAGGALLSGRVDPRVLVVLATVAAGHEITVAEFPQTEAEQAAGLAPTTVRLTEVDGQPATEQNPGATALQGEVAALNRPYRPGSVFVEIADGTPPSLVLSFPGGTP